MEKVFLYILVISTYGIFFLDQDFIYQLGREDGPIEYMGAAFFLIASCLLFTIYVKSSGAGNSFGKFRTKRNLFYFLLGLLLFVCFGEEITWGQRIIGWSTPSTLEAINRQNETNLHNLDIFYWGGFNLVTVFTAGCLTYFVIIPLLNRYSRRANGFFNHIGLPCPPLWIGGLFLINNILVQILQLMDLNLNAKSIHFIYELKESNYAFSYVVFGVYELKKFLGDPKVREIKTVPFS